MGVRLRRKRASGLWATPNRRRVCFRRFRPSRSPGFGSEARPAGFGPPVGRRASARQPGRCGSRFRPPRPRALGSADGSGAAPGRVGVRSFPSRSYRRVPGSESSYFRSRSGAERGHTGPSGPTSSSPRARHDPLDAFGQPPGHRRVPAAGKPVAGWSAGGLHEVLTRRAGRSRSGLDCPSRDPKGRRRASSEPNPTAQRGRILRDEVPPCGFDRQNAAFGLPDSGRSGKAMEKHARKGNAAGPEEDPKAEPQER